MAGTLSTPMHAEVLARYRCLLQGAEGSPAPPLARMPSILDDFRAFYHCRAGGAPFTWSRFAQIVSEDLVAPLDAVVGGTCAALAAEGVPAGWRGDEEAQWIVERSRDVAALTRDSLAEDRVADALASLVEILQTLAARVCTGPVAAATRDALRRLLPLLGCVTPTISARAWAILGLRGQPVERFADGSLVDEPAPPWPTEPLFPDGVLGLLAWTT